ncbi:hypothetical protein [Flammeovirga sp. OC4]|uniref:hypothetical protein n=1 Tax=Flammeovirga sp. OC4 TaxID=1382345 RepID=UPI0005C6369A|nr:hypothetical protein [Flammeovirga sp. OC4]
MVPNSFETITTTDKRIEIPICIFLNRIGIECFCRLNVSKNVVQATKIIHNKVDSVVVSFSENNGETLIEINNNINETVKPIVSRFSIFLL